MKVLHIITGLGDGGAEAALYRLCKFDNKNNHIIVSLTNDGKYGSLLKDSGIPVSSLNMQNGSNILFALFNIYKILKENKPDIVQTWMFHADLLGGIVSKIAGVRNIYWGVHHTYLIKGESKILTRIVAKCNSLLSNFVPKRIIYCANKSKLIHEANGFNKDKSIVIHNGYDINEFNINADTGLKFRNELGIPSDLFLIGHVGRYDPAKDYSNLISSLKILKNTGKKFKAVLIGSNLDSNNLSLIKMINNANLENHILLLGRRSDISSIMNGIDLFVLSSSSEAFPNVLNEAMSCSTPCVSTNVGDASIILGSTGWIIPPKDSLSLSNSIENAIIEKQFNPESWSARKLKCRSHIVLNFSIQKMVDQYNAAWSIF